MVKVYLASSFKLKDRVERIAEKLKKNGYDITREWWHTNFKKDDGMDELSDREWYQHEDVEWVVQESFDAIEEADIYILVAPEDYTKKFNGANIEFGYALAKGLECYSIGEIERTAMYQPLNKCSHIDELIKELEA